MNIRYGVLLCKHGSLGHGPIEDVQAEFENSWKDRGHELEIIEYNHQTHDFVNGQIVQRTIPLRFYSPEELYAHESYKVTFDLWRWTELFSRETNLYMEKHHSDIEVRVLYNDFTDGYHRVLATFWYDGEPFMVGQYYSPDEDQTDHTRFITNPEIYWRAVDHLIELNRPEISDCVDSKITSDQFTRIGYHSFVL